MPPSIAVWRSVRLHGDTKTEKSGRTLALPRNAVTALREHRKWQAEARLAAGPLWLDTGLVFTTSVGTPLDASHVRRDFRALCKKAGIEGVWAPRELRHTFVSVMSVSGVAVEEIARLAGHASSRTTETIYRKPRVLHQAGEKPQVSRSQRCRNYLPGLCAAAGLTRHVSRAVPLGA